jgi:hypothetical protein
MEIEAVVLLRAERVYSQPRPSPWVYAVLTTNEVGTTLSAFKRRSPCCSPSR